MNIKLLALAYYVPMASIGFCRLLLDAVNEATKPDQWRWT